MITGVIIITTEDSSTIAGTFMSQTETTVHPSEANIIPMPISSRENLIPKLSYPRHFCLGEKTNGGGGAQF